MRVKVHFSYCQHGGSPVSMCMSHWIVRAQSSLCCVCAHAREVLMFVHSLQLHALLP